MSGHRDSAPMTLAEKCAVVVGSGMWTIPGCERLGIPSWTVSDGPVGVRGRLAGPGLVIPNPTALAAAWDPDLVREVGAALGQECIDKEIDVLLGPTTNIQRAPRSGRHFECFSEDPELSARMTVAYIDGVQSMGVAACVKHFAANDQETDRFEIDAQVDERTLREIHYPPFEAAVREAGVRAVMGAYNFVNGHQACAHPILLEAVLRGEWGFDGIVISDWNAIKETVAPALAGLDVEMPGPGRWWGAGQLEDAVRVGRVPESCLDEKVDRIVELLRWRGRLGSPTPAPVVERPVDRAAHRALVRRAAAEGMVLLRNDGLLPLTRSSTVALIGPCGAATSLLGGGSAMLEPHRRTNILRSLRDRLAPGSVRSALGARLSRRPPTLFSPDLTAELFAGPEPTGNPFAVLQLEHASTLWARGAGRWPSHVPVVSARVRGTVVPETTGRYELLAAGIGSTTLRVDGERVVGNDEHSFAAGLGLRGSVAEVHLEAGRPYRFELEHRPARTTDLVLLDIGFGPSPPSPADLLDEAAELAAWADVAVVVVGTSDQWETEGSDRADLLLPQHQDELVRRVRAANPRTVVVLNCGAPVELPWLDEVPAALLAWYPGQEGGDAIVDVLLGDTDPGGRMPTTWAWKEADTPTAGRFPDTGLVARYDEGPFVGYRWYEDRGVTPMLPFGHGQSYTSFEWSDPRLTGEGTARTIEVDVTNVGPRRGREVVQVYIAPTDPAVHRPPKELAGFAKIDLDSGATGTVAIRLRDRAFARWDHERGWVTDPGHYRVIVAASTLDVRSEIDLLLD